MGSFLVHFHVRSSASEPVRLALEELSLGGAWLSQSKSGWVSVWEFEASHQDDLRIRAITHHLSDSLENIAIAFLVHDSDLMRYWLYEKGELLDEFHSNPGYWGDFEISDERAAANIPLLLDLCVEGTDRNELEQLLAQHVVGAGHDSQPGTSTFVFEEERLKRFSEKLGIPVERVGVDYGDIGSQVSAQELGVSWIGLTQQPDQNPTSTGRGGTKAEADLASDERGTQESDSPFTPIYQAIESSDQSTIRNLITHGIDFNKIPTGLTVTPIAFAASKGNLEAVKQLAAAGADLQKKKREGATPLRMAIQALHLEVVTQLVEGGADLHEKDPEIGSLLHVAMMNPSPAILKLLIDLGLDPNEMSPSGMTPLQSINIQIDGLRQIVDQIPDVAASIFQQQISDLLAIREALDNGAE